VDSVAVLAVVAWRITGTGETKASITYFARKSESKEVYKYTKNNCNFGASLDSIAQLPNIFEGIVA
jgi:hypothetical protein